MNHPLSGPISSRRLALRWLFVGAALIASYTTVLAQPGGPVISFTETSRTVNENGGSVTLTVEVANLPEGQASCQYSCVPGTAVAVDDYVNNSGTCYFAYPSLPFTITIEIVNDGVAENSENFQVILSNPVGATIGNGTCTVTITDDDGGGSSATVSFEYASWACDEGDGTITITVLMTGSPTGPVSVDYSTSDGSAAAGIDYSAASGTLTWQPSEAGTTKSFTITILNDTEVEEIETVTLTLSNPVNATLGSQVTAILNIVDDDTGCP